MTTSGKGRSKLQAVARLLADLANLDEGKPDLRRFRTLHKKAVDALNDREVLDLRDALRFIWDTPDLRERDWYASQVRHSLHHDTLMHDVREKIEPPNPGRLALRLFKAPPLTPLEDAMFYFQRHMLDLAKHCGNVACDTPYFIATKRWQKYCTADCAEPSTREQKRQWWRDNRGKDRD